MPVKKKSALAMDISFGSANLAQKALFARHMAMMLDSGLTIVEALAIAQDSAQGVLKKTLKKVRKSVESGQPLSVAFSRHPKTFSGLFVSATEAGEASGTLPGNLDNIATQLEKEKELVSKVKGAMLYPSVVMVAAFLLGSAMTFVVLPKITPLFKGLKMELPFTTRALIWLADTLQAHGKLIFPLFLFSVFFLVWLVRRKFMHPFTHKALLHFPIIKHIIRNANIARFCRVLGTLLKSGLNIDEAVAITKKTLANYYYASAVTAVGERIGKGAKLSENLMQYSHLFPVMVTRMVRVGEESGKLDETLEYLAKFYELEVDAATKNLSTAIEPLLLLFIGLVVGFLALSIITPIYSITGGIRK